MKINQPLPYASDDPPLFVPEFAAIGREILPATEFVRHQIGFGATGSGKTESFVRPLTRAVLRYPEPAAIAWSRQRKPNLASPAELRFAALVIDPKHELVETVMAEATEGEGRRTIRFGPGQGYCVSLFEGDDPAAMAPSQVVDRLMSLTDYAERDSQSRDPFWGHMARLLLTEFLGIDRYISRNFPGGLPKFWRSFSERARLAEIVSNVEELPPFDPANYFQSLHCFFTAASRHAGGHNPLIALYCDLLRDVGVPRSQYASVETLGSLAENTSTSLIIVFHSLVGSLLDPMLNECLWINPHAPPPAERILRIHEVVANGDVVIYSPLAGLNETSVDETIGRSLKSIFFRASLGAKPAQRGVAYIADEAQRFLSSQTKSSEAHFLDVGRAYRAGAVLATQSTASLIYRLSQQQGGDDRAHSVLNIILANCGTKFFFRSTETSTNGTLMSLLPNPENSQWPHICEIRGVASLRVGEAFYLRADGDWGRAQIRIAERDGAR